VGKEKKKKKGDTAGSVLHWHRHCSTKREEEKKKMEKGKGI